MSDLPTGNKAKGSIKIKFRTKNGCLSERELLKLIEKGIEKLMDDVSAENAGDGIKFDRYVSVTVK